MPDFSLMQTPNFLATATDAFQAGQQQRMQRARQNALAGYAADPNGTRNALIGMGDLATAGQLQGYENNQAQAQYRQQQMQRQQQVQGYEDQDRQRAGQDRARGLLVNEARALRMLPQDQRAGSYNTRAAPLLAELGFTPEVIAQALDGGLTDEELDGFIVQMGGELESRDPRYFQTGQGIVAVGPDGQAQEIYQDPLADLERQRLEAQIAATQAQVGQRNAAAAKARRPAAPRAAAPAGGATSLPPGFKWD